MVSNKDEETCSSGFQLLRDAKKLLSSCSEIFDKWRRSKRSMFPTFGKIYLHLQGTTKLLVICVMFLTQGIFCKSL